MKIDFYLLILNEKDTMQQSIRIKWHKINQGGRLGLCLGLPQVNDICM